MAKDLPYFKFFVSEWNDGDITLEDYEVQGLFINICSYYWSNECSLSFKKTMKKFKDADYDLFKSLIDSDIIKVEDDELIITFLDEQQDERDKTSKIRRKGGLASAEARKQKKLLEESNINPTENQHVLNSCSTETQLLREEKRRKEEKREEENALSFLKSHSTKWETFTMQNKKRFSDWDKMLELYSYKVDEEDIEYTYKKLIARLQRWMGNWESNNSNNKPLINNSINETRDEIQKRRDELRR